MRGGGNFDNYIITSQKPWPLVHPNTFCLFVYIKLLFMSLKSYLTTIISSWGSRGHDCMVVGFTTTCAISAYHHWRCEFEPHSHRGVLDTTLCDKLCQWLATCWWFSLDSSTNWNIVESQKVALNTIKLLTPYSFLTNVKNVVIFVVRRSYIVCADSDTKATELGYIFTFHIGL